MSLEHGAPQARDNALGPGDAAAKAGGAVVGLDDTAATRLLTRVVGAHSPSGHEAEVARLLVEAMVGAGAAAHVDEVGNAVGTWGDGPLQVTFLGHMDTVKGVIDVRVEDGELYGRGSVDAKGSLCVAVAAASRLDREVLSRLTLRVVGAVEEEAPSSRGARHAVTTLPRPDLLLIGEPSSWDRYTLGYKGRLALRLEARRGSAHGAREEASAAEMLLDAYAALRLWVERDNDGLDAAFERLQCTLRAVASEDDGLEERCSGEVVFRLPLRWTTVQLSRSLNAVGLGSGVSLDALSAEEPYRADNGSQLARAFRVAIRSLGGRPRPALKTGTSDMNVVAPHWPVPMLAYGPGDASLDHTPEERLPIADYLRSIEVLRTALTSLVAEDNDLTTTP